MDLRNKHLKGVIMSTIEDLKDNQEDPRHPIEESLKILTKWSH